MSMPYDYSNTNRKLDYQIMNRLFVFGFILYNFSVNWYETVAYVCVSKLRISCKMDVSSNGLHELNWKKFHH